jgi:P pilus assembly chaperone PapD
MSNLANSWKMTMTKNEFQILNQSSVFVTITPFNSSDVKRHRMLLAEAVQMLSQMTWEWCRMECFHTESDAMPEYTVDISLNTDAEGALRSGLLATKTFRKD